MAQYKINDTTLIAMGDAIRDKSGHKRISGLSSPNDEPFYTIQVDTSSDGWRLFDTELIYRNTYLITDFLGDRAGMAKSVYYSLECETNDLSAFTIYFTVNSSTGAMKTYNLLTDGVINKNTYIPLGQYLPEIWIRVPQDKINSGITGNFTIKLWACDENQQFIGTNRLTPLEMIDVVNNLNAIPEEAFTITGNCQYRFSYGGWDWFIENYGSRIKTSNISNCQYMFSGYGGETILFDINCFNGSVSLAHMFYTANKLKSLPKINCKVADMSNIFSSCYMLREIPDDYFNDWDFSSIDNLTSPWSGGMSSMFAYCYSLRKIPEEILSHMNPVGYYSTLPVYGLCSNCYALDEVTGLDLNYTAELTSDIFGGSFQGTYRLKNLIFKTPNNQPIIVKMKNQFIDLTRDYVGYTASYGKSYLLNYNSGITADKEVKDDATYQALKNDPDWFTTKIEYCRYNHDSAINTINSLPDTSAYLATAGGTNTIKFYGKAGSATDGGAINTLTEEEIAVAAAKGWTVSLS